MTPIGAAELWARCDAEVGEGPFWDARVGRLGWVDIPSGRLFERQGDRTTTVQLDTMLGAAIPLRSGEGYAVAVREGVGLLHDGQLQLVDRVLSGSRRMNDAACDSRGRLWAGSLDMQSTVGSGVLHRWDGGRSVAVLTGLDLPNGIGWSPDESRIYLADSLRQEIYWADFDVDAGRLGALNLFASVETGLPDGLAVDVEGNVWVAVWDGGVVIRFDESGVRSGEVSVPLSRPSSCAFGPDGTLYITSAQADHPEPLAGSVFAVATDTRGAPVGTFGGLK